MQKETHLARAGNALLNGALWMISVRAIDRALVLVLGFSLWRLFNLPFHLICQMVFFAGFTWRFFPQIWVRLLLCLSIGYCLLYFYPITNSKPAAFAGNPAQSFDQACTLRMEEDLF